MFKEIRKQKRELFDEDIKSVLLNGEFGTLATISENGYPYSLPLSYVYYNDCIYFHGAKEGHKLENIKNNNKVSFSVVTDTLLQPKTFSTKFKSVVVFGTASKVDDDLKAEVLLQLIKKYSPDHLDTGAVYLDKVKGITQVMQISIDHMTGKAKI